MTDKPPLIRVGFQGRLGSYAAEAEAVARKTLRHAARELSLGKSNEISLTLCDGPAIRKLNRQWRGKDRPTDVLSFPLNEMKAGQKPPPGPVGDIIVALPVARRAARELNLPWERHLAHLVIHGLLHLLGYDHHEDREADRMESLERKLLVKIR